MRITRRQLRRIIQEVSGVPSWPERHFAWRNTAFTKDGDVRYINDVAEPETVQASMEMGTPVPPGSNVLIVKGAHPNSESVWLHDAEVLDLIEREGWHERPPPPGAKSGFWDGKGEWSEDPEEGSYDLPPEIDMPPAIPEGRRIIAERSWPKFPNDEEEIGRWYDAISDMIYADWGALGITPTENPVEVNQVIEALRSLADDLEGEAI